MKTPGATDAIARERFRKARLEQHPQFVQAVFADARFACASLGRPVADPTPLRLTYEAIRLAIVSDAFIGLVLYRAKARLQALGIPLLPYVAHRLAIASAGVSIGNPVLVEAGIYLPHGQVVIDGMVNIGRGRRHRCERSRDDRRTRRCHGGRRTREGVEVKAALSARVAFFHAVGLAED